MFPHITVALHNGLSPTSFDILLDRQSEHQAELSTCLNKSCTLFTAHFSFIKLINLTGRFKFP